MNAPKTPGPALFASVRSSKDLALAAFAGALLVAFALHAGAFIPKLGEPESADKAPAMEASPRTPAPAVVARRPAIARGAPAATPEPCGSPRG